MVTKQYDEPVSWSTTVLIFYCTIILIWNSNWINIYPLPHYTFYTTLLQDPCHLPVWIINKINMATDQINKINMQLYICYLQHLQRSYMGFLFLIYANCRILLTYIMHGIHKCSSLFNINVFNLDPQSYRCRIIGELINISNIFPMLQRFVLRLDLTLNIVPDNHINTIYRILILTRVF